MKITIWSNTNAHSCSSSSLMAIAAYMAMTIPDEMDDKYAIIQSQFKYNNLDYPLLGAGVLKDTFFGTGVDALLSAAKSRFVSSDDAYNASISLFNERILFYRSTNMNNKESFYSDMKKFLDVIHALNDSTENVFIDLDAGINPFTTSVLEDADVVIVMLSQNQHFISETLESLKRVTLKNVIYCIGNYHSESTMNLHNIKSMYKPLRHKLFAVPHDMDYADAISSGNAMNFLQANNLGHMDKKNPHYAMQEHIEKGVKMLNKIKRTKEE